MNLFELFVKIGVKDEATKNIEGISSKLGNGLKTAAKIGTAAVGAAAGAIVALTKQAVENYAEYEQLVGGIETLYGNAGQSMEEYVKDVAEQTRKRGFEPDLEAIAERWKAFEAVEQKVLSNASVAYKTAGLSANKYMETITGFTAALNQSIDDTSVVADYADMAVRDMSDNANKMGTSMESIQNAYQGFAKQNFTMLDNLKLGYGGTKGEMERLLIDANNLDSSLGLVNEEGKLTAYTFADIVKAINVVQTEMGITGTTAKEATETISGSLASAKSAWANLVTGFADDSADLDKLFGNLTDSVVGYTDESGKQVKGVLDNLLPAIEKSLGGIANLIEGAAPKIIEILPGLVERIIPSVISAATGMVDAVVKVVPDLLNTVVGAIMDNAPALIDSAIVLIAELSNGILSQLPRIAQLGLDLIVSLATGITNSLDTLIPTIIDVVLQIVDTLTKPKTLMNIIEAGIELLLGLIDGIIGAIPQLIRAVPKIIASIVTVLIAELPAIISAAIEIVFALIDGIIGAIPELVAAVPNLIIGIVNGLLNNLDKIILAAPQIILSLITGLIGAIPELVKALPRVIMSIVNTFKSYDWGSIGKNIVNGIKDGIAKMWSNLKKWFTEKWDDLVGGVKDLLGIHSPSRVFAAIGKNMALGVGVGWDDEFGDIQDEINGSLDFGDGYIGTFGGGYDNSYIGGGSVGRPINITQNIYAQKKSAAQLMQEARWQAKMGVLANA